MAWQTLPATVTPLLPGTLLLDLAGPAEAWRLANQQLTRRGGPAAYRLRFVGPRPDSSTSALAIVPSQSKYAFIAGYPSSRKRRSP
jgi:hypothetical protein